MWDFIKKERAIWHQRFIPSLIAGIGVAVLTIFFQLTAHNVVMFASLGASAAILTHRFIHRLTILYTVIFSYLVALIVSLPIFYLMKDFEFAFPISILLVVTMTTLTLYLLNIFHPPAISASIAFLLIQDSVMERVLIFGSVIILLIVIKLLTYFFYYENFGLRNFAREFKFWEKKVIRK